MEIKLGRFKSKFSFHLVEILAYTQLTTELFLSPRHNTYWLEQWNLHVTHRSSAALEDSYMEKTAQNYQTGQLSLRFLQKDIQYVMRFFMCKTLQEIFYISKKYIIQMDSFIKCYLHQALSKAPAVTNPYRI